LRKKSKTLKFIAKLQAYEANQPQEIDKQILIQLY